MKLQSIEIEGYRGIGSLKLALDSEMTILLGQNGVGKTSILDAVASILQIVQTAWTTEQKQGSIPTANINQRDIRSGRAKARIAAVFGLEKVKYENGDNLRIISTSNDPDETSQVVFNLWQFSKNGGLDKEPHPLMVYYRQDRGFERNKQSNNNSTIKEVWNSSLNGDLQAISNLQIWWDKRDAQEAREVRDGQVKYRDPQLEAIRKLVKKIDGFSGIKYSSTENPEGLYFQKQKDNLVHVDNLSSGERSFIILLADLARRLQTAYPEKELGDIPGIVLIDEIELNLHPAWQSKIISTLRSVFASCQFVITTHSPQVISAVESDHVVQLHADKKGNITPSKPLRTKGQTSNYLLEGVFDANERYPVIDDMIERFNHAVDQNDLNKASDLIVQIEQAIEGSPPEILVFRKRLARLRAGQ